jgi:hypothetical protein
LGGMMKKMNWMIWGLWIPFLFMLDFKECIAGVVIEQVMKDREGRASKVILYFSENQLRTDHPEGGLTTIMDFKGDRMVMVDHRSKSYVEIKFSQWEKEVAEQIKQEVPSIKPKARRIVVRRAGETATINGFRTEKVQVFADGELIEENWVTRDVDRVEVEKVMERVAQGFSKDFRYEMKESREIYEKLKRYGFPILVKDYTLTHGLGGIDILEVKKLEHKELKEEVFLPSSEYKRIIPVPSQK